MPPKSLKPRIVRGFPPLPAIGLAVSLVLVSSSTREDTRFADSLLDHRKDHHSHRGWTTPASLALEALGVGSVLLLPQLHTEGLPQFALWGIMAVPAPPVRASARTSPFVHIGSQKCSYKPYPRDAGDFSSGPEQDRD